MSLRTDWLLENFLKFKRHNLTPLFQQSYWQQVVWKMVKKVWRRYPQAKKYLKLRIILVIQNVLASNMFCTRSIRTWLSIFWKENQRIFDPIPLPLFLKRNVLFWKLATSKSEILEFKYFYLDAHLWNCLLFISCEFEKVDEQFVDNGIKIDRPQSEKCAFFITFFSDLFR